MLIHTCLFPYLRDTSDDSKTISPRLRTNLSNMIFKIINRLTIDFSLIAQPAGVRYNHCVSPSVRPLLSCQPKVKVTSCFVYKVIRDL